MGLESGVCVVVLILLCPVLSSLLELHNILLGGLSSKYFIAYQKRKKIMEMNLPFNPQFFL